MMKVLLLLCILLLLFYGVNSQEQTEREKQCTENGEKQQTRISYSYFSQHHIGFNKNYAIDNFDMKSLSLCFCETTFNQTFLSFPYLDDRDTFHDAVVFCVNNSVGYQTSGIYDEYELFDTMLFKRIQSFPNSVIDPVSNNDEHDESNETGCYDFHGIRTKTVLGQRTCILAADLAQEIKFTYSGPLLGNAMVNFVNNGGLTFAQTKCITTTKNSLPVDQEDHCYYYISNTNLNIQCCCSQSPELCSPKSLPNKDTLFCMPGRFETLVTNDPLYYLEEKEISVIEYITKYTNSACSIEISTMNDDNQVFVSYGSQETCTVKNEQSMEAKNFCSSTLTFEEPIVLKRCCKDGHFCNQRLMLEPQQKTNCSYKKNDVGFLIGDSKCDFFVDIQLSKRVKILLHFNADLPKQQRHQMNGGITHYYAYLQILEADSDGCSTKIYDPSHVNEFRPFIHGICEGENCDEDPKYNSSQNSTFELLDTKFVFSSDAKDYVPTSVQLPGWICFVEIKQIEDGTTVIQAGALTDFFNHPKCLEQDLVNIRSTFCCAHIFDIQQKDTICTVEKLIKQYKEINVAKINIGTSEIGNGKGYFSNCFIRDLPIDSCLSEAGCFETRILEYSKNSDVIEPAGCIDSAEKYVTDNLPLASISLGCRSEENSNKCSVVQTPDGQQRILCCCNGKECKNDFKNLPKQIGKNISSFKDPN